MQIACPVCDENGCRRCDERGYFEVKGCPQDVVGADVINFLKYADYAKRGVLPNDGGLLHQPNWFVDATSFLVSEEQRVKQQQWKS